MSSVIINVSMAVGFVVLLILFGPSLLDALKNRGNGDEVSQTDNSRGGELINQRNPNPNNSPRPHTNTNEAAAETGNLQEAWETLRSQSDEAIAANDWSRGRASGQ